MDDDRDDFPSELRGAVAWLTEETLPAPTDHPAPERWTVYLRGGLQSEEEDRLAEHLVRCRDCFDLVQAIDAFEVSDEAGESAQITAAALSRLVLSQVSESVNVPMAQSPPIGDRRPRWSGPPLALAATLALAVLGLWGWVLHQNRTLAGLRAPTGNAQIVDLISGERAATAGQPMTAHPGPLTLVIHPEVPRQAYRLVVLETASGRRRATLSGLQATPRLTLNCHLPEGLPPGVYRLEIGADTDLSSGEGPEHVLLRVISGEGDL